jgi:threonyl-tRNA synthetase
MLDAHAPALEPDDHRALAARLDLLHFQDEAPGMAFWHPRGLTLYRLLEDAARRHVVAGGYQEVRTPQLLRRPIWEQSGHWQHHAGAMFTIEDGAASAALKPVSCPGHIQLVARQAPSWRDLPLRLAEMGACHRDEAAGSLCGLLRLRQFTQDDGHIFCALDHVVDEVAAFCAALPAFYRGFGFHDVALALSTRPAERAGDEASWDQAEQLLGDAVGRAGLPFTVQPGGGAFYGPKLEYTLHDRRGRAWQCGTIQLDLVLPRRFELRYVDAGGERRHVVMLHRALYGSIERFLGILLEHHRGALPPWLAPEQVLVAPVSADHLPWAATVRDRLAAAGVRVRLESDGTLGRRIALAHHLGFPFVAVVGAAEAAAGTVALRGRERHIVAPLDAVVAEVVARGTAPAT